MYVNATYRRKVSRKAVDGSNIVVCLLTFPGAALSGDTEPCCETNSGSGMIGDDVLAKDCGLDMAVESCTAGDCSEIGEIRHCLFRFAAAWNELSAMVRLRCVDDGVRPAGWNLSWHQR
jgi:hypothetical protein